MASQALNLTLRLSQRVSSRRVSHVLSGNARSLSSTSSSAARASATRTTAFATAYSGASSSKVLSAIRAYSSEAPAQKGQEQDAVNETYRDRPTKQDLDAPYGRKDLTPDRVVGPSQTLFIARLPFFTTEQDLRDVFGDSGTIKKIRMSEPKRPHNAPFAFITMSSVEEAVAIVESASEEPYVLEGRELSVNYARRKPIPPSDAVFFNNFSGDLNALREFLGPLARTVDNAWFTRDKATGNWAPSGIIQCRSVEDASTIVEACHGKPGPDGLPVMIRFMRPKRPAQTPEQK